MAGGFLNGTIYPLSSEGEVTAATDFLTVLEVFEIDSLRKKLAHPGSFGIGTSIHIIQFCRRMGAGNSKGLAETKGTGQLMN